MPSGTTHDRITLWILPWIVFATYLVTHNGELTLLMAGGFFFSGLMFGPDLDIHSTQYKRWGILRWIWLPYRRLFRHRSLFSHGFLIGTLIRVVYLVVMVFAIAIFLVAIAQLLVGFPWNWQKFILKVIDLLTNKYSTEAIVLWLGLELGAMSHSVSDWISSAIKKQRKKTMSKR
ncbi:MAG: metal-binding protein [Cyanobacteria bacterium P01_F01_bin.143]